MFSEVLKVAPLSAVQIPKTLIDQIRSVVEWQLKIKNEEENLQVQLSQYWNDATPPEEPVRTFYGIKVQADSKK